MRNRFWILNNIALFKIRLSAIRTLNSLNAGTKSVLVFDRWFVFIQKPRTSAIAPAALETNRVDNDEDGKKAYDQGCGQCFEGHDIATRTEFICQYTPFLQELVTITNCFIIQQSQRTTDSDLLWDFFSREVQKFFNEKKEKVLRLISQR